MDHDPQSSSRNTAYDKTTMSFIHYQYEPVTVPPVARRHHVVQTAGGTLGTLDTTSGHHVGARYHRLHEGQLDRLWYTPRRTELKRHHHHQHYNHPIDSNHLVM